MNNENQEVLYSSLIDINNYEDLSEEEIVLSKDDSNSDFNSIDSFLKKFGDVDSFVKSFLTIKVKYNCSQEKNFTKCTLEEYLLFKDYFSSVMGKDNKKQNYWFSINVRLFSYKGNYFKKKKF